MGITTPSTSARDVTPSQCVAPALSLLPPAPSYRVVRFTQGGSHPMHKKIIRQGLTYEQAREWCSRPDTEGPRWFDAFCGERGDTYPGQTLATERELEDWVFGPAPELRDLFTPDA